MVQGAADCCDAYGTDYLGGDTKECPQLVLAGTSLGLVGKEGLLTRKGASQGDLLMMTGTAGMAAAGLLALELGIDENRAITALFEPQPRVKEGALLSATGTVTSCTDVSDGLSTSLRELALASGTAFEVDRASVPIGPDVERIALEAGKDPLEIALHGGGDYQLLFTVRPDGLDRVLEALGSDARVIGQCIGGDRNILKGGDARSELEPKGYEHFRR